MIRTFLIVILVVVLLGNGRAGQITQAQAGERCFPETGYCIAGRFRQYWEQHGGLPIFGFPVAAPGRERNPATGREYQVQWFERARFEARPEHAAPYDVLLSRLGDTVLRQQGRNWQTEFPGEQSRPDCLYFETTAHNLCDRASGACGGQCDTGFKRYWEQHGLEFDGRSGKSHAESLALFGAPLSQPVVERNGDGDTVTTQWFERARFEYHPANPAQYRVLLGLVAKDARIGEPVDPQHTTYRVLVSTDLGGDTDEVATFVHLLHYTDILKLEAIVSSPGPGSRNQVENLREWIERTDMDFLRERGHTSLMSEAQLLKITHQGSTSSKAPGKGQSTAGSRAIVERALAPDPLGLDRPLWVLAWGSMTDLAQALYDEPSIAGRIRIFSIGAFNTTADTASRDYVFRFMQQKYPSLWWVESGMQPPWSHDTFLGVYRGGNQTGEWDAQEFMLRNIRGHGSTHNGKFSQETGDAIPWAQHNSTTRNILKEGDATTFFYLLSPVVGGVGNVDDPTQESWGGRFRRLYPGTHPNFYTDLDASAEECQATVNKWRVAFLSSWKDRWDWYGN
jgi:hypothetical protein